MRHRSDTSGWPVTVTFGIPVVNQANKLVYNEKFIRVFMKNERPRKKKYIDKVVQEIIWNDIQSYRSGEYYQQWKRMRQFKDLGFRDYIWKIKDKGLTNSDTPGAGTAEVGIQDWLWGK